MAPRNKRLKSIHTPPRRDRLAPSQRPPTGEDGPTDYQLMRRAETLGYGIYCEIGSPKTLMTGKNDGRSTSTAIGLLRFQDKITQPQFRAGAMYAYLRSAWFGQPMPKAVSLYRVIHEHLSSDSAIAYREEETSEEKQERMYQMRLEYQRGDGRLQKLPYYTKIRITLRATIIDDLYPTNDKWLQRLRIGLSELADCWRTDK